jgi:ABC-type multidrug transport system fused ATPase/permease subunit
VKIGELQVYIAAFTSLQSSLTILFQMSTFKAAAQAGVERIAGVLKTASTTPDPIGYEANVPGNGQIVFFNVSFGYGPDRPVLKDVNLTIPYGQRVALVGPSGAGKSTITQLLLRLYDPDQGAILIGGLNIRHCRGAELRRRFGVVPQTPFIFTTSIRHNLCVASPDAGEAEVRLACERANAWEYISRLPDGLDTPVGEGGSTLSGGQRQRLAIARALLAEPQYFIFDEATSALDTVSEKLVQDATENAVAGKTALIIAHRLATVKNCDRILVIDDGRIIQDGRYDELVGQAGLFRDLVQGQVLKG